MFYLSRIEHTLRLPPDLLSLPLEQAIRQELNKLFLDKVVANLGLCVSVGAIKSIEGGFIHAGDGASTYTADFMLVVFRPFVGEVISARLKESDANGLRLTLGFFEDIYIPAYYLPNPSRFEPDSRNKQTGSWTWHYQDADNTIDYPIEGDGEIRFQVNSVKYPSIPVERKPEDTKPFAAMLIMLIVLILLHTSHSEDNTRDLSIEKVWVPSVGGYEMGGKAVKVSQRTV